VVEKIVRGLSNSFAQRSTIANAEIGALTNDGKFLVAAEAAPMIAL
jgi:hypothetical protein